MGTATLALVAGELFAPQISHALYGSSESCRISCAPPSSGLWATMNYDQLTALFRVEERSVSYSIASLANVLLTVGATIFLVVSLDKGPLGVIVGNFTGTLAIYLVLARVPPHAARVRVRPRRVSADDRLGHAVHPVGDRVERDRLRRPLSALAAQGPARARPVRDRDADLGRPPLSARRVPHRVARVRVLDPRGRGQADLRLRADVRHVLLLLGRARARARRAVDRAPADEAGLLRRRRGRPAARVRVRRLRGLRRRRDVDRTGRASRVELDGHRSRGSSSGSRSTSR